MTLYVHSLDEFLRFCEVQYSPEMRLPHPADALLGTWKVPLIEPISSGSWAGETLRTTIRQPQYAEFDRKNITIDGKRFVVWRRIQ